jgi:hypothetical protein
MSLSQKLKKREHEGNEDVATNPKRAQFEKTKESKEQFVYELSREERGFNVVKLESASLAEPVAFVANETLIRRGDLSYPRHVTNVPGLQELLQRIVVARTKKAIGELTIVHVFAGNMEWPTQNSHTHDFDESTRAKYHNHPVEFLNGCKAQGLQADVIVFSPPANQLLLKQYLVALGAEREAYFYALNKRNSVKQGDAGLAKAIKTKLEPLLKPDGIAICVSFKSAGIGKSLGFDLKELHVIPHAQDGKFLCHDTMITVEERLNSEDQLSSVALWYELPSKPSVFVSRVWAMFASEGATFSVKPIQQLIQKYVCAKEDAPKHGTLDKFMKRSTTILPVKFNFTRENPIVVDPFARKSQGIVGAQMVTNDLNSKLKKTSPTHFSLDAVEFLDHLCNNQITFEKKLPLNLKGQVDAILLDPPYSDMQSTQLYSSAGVDEKAGYTINADLYFNCKQRASRLLKKGGFLFPFGWSSVGAGRGFALREVLYCAHGAAHDDTVVTVEEFIGISE